MRAGFNQTTGGDRSSVDAKVEVCFGIAHNKDPQNPKTRNYSRRMEQGSIVQSPEHVNVKDSDGGIRNKNSSPRTKSYIKRPEQGLSDVNVTVIGQGPTSIKAGIDQIMGGGRSNGNAKEGDCSGVAHNKEPQNIKLDEFVLAAVRGKQKLWMKDAKAEEFLVSCVCGSIQFVKILNFLKCVQCKRVRENLAWSPEHATDRSNKDINAKEFLSVELNKECGPKTRSHSERIEQESLGQSPEYAKVKGCDEAAKVEDCSGVTHNKEPQNTCTADAKAKEFLGVQHNKDNGQKTRSYSERIEQGTFSQCPQHMLRLKVVMKPLR